ncbi:MAG TPA: hypothetical protein EYQ14_03320 [Gammaproteobacteria bacterium]|nr:hypothetical protein [Gammaproteobacteria bacterium]HIL97161.1 hypothetical protein [Pseudomonadales bacterium]
MDNVFIERLWRSVKYEEVYLHAYESLTQARNGLEKYFELYNAKRKHHVIKITQPVAHQHDPHSQRRPRPGDDTALQHPPHHQRSQ